MLGQTREVFLWWPLFHSIDHLNRIIIGAVEHSELRLRSLSILLLRLIVITKVWNAFFLISSSCAIHLILLILQVHIGSIFLEVFQINLLSSKLDNMILLALVDLAKFAHMCLDCLIGAKFSHAILKVFEVVLRSETHVPLLVQSHYSVQITRFMSLAAEFELVLFSTFYHGIDIE